MNAHDTVHHSIDFAALGILLVTLMDMLPHATAVLSFIWVLIRLYETRTVQNWIRRIRGKS